MEMKKLLSIFFLLLFSTTTIVADDFDAANQYYADGNYSEAVLAYESILQSGRESAELYYNLGNAYYRQGALASAILNYERALKLAPYDDDIRHNLEFVRAQTVDKIDMAGEMLVTKWWRYVRNLASSDSWAYAAVGLFVFMLLMLSIYIFTKPAWLRKTGFALVVVSLFLCVLSWVFAEQQKTFMQGGDEAIVFSPTVTVKSTPDNSGTDLFILHEGTKVKVGDSVGGWIKITMQDGNSGWLPLVSVKVI